MSPDNGAWQNAFFTKHPLYKQGKASPDEVFTNPNPNRRDKVKAYCNACLQADFSEYQTLLSRGEVPNFTNEEDIILWRKQLNHLNS